ncbi:hypothetical protein [Streptomyces sp. NPDC002276]
MRPPPAVGPDPALPARQRPSEPAVRREGRRPKKPPARRPGPRHRPAPDPARHRIADKTSEITRPQPPPDTVADLTGAVATTDALHAQHPAPASRQAHHRPGRSDHGPG